MTRALLVRTKGGLGNQLFQYAKALSLRSISGTKVYLDIGWFSQRHSHDTSRQLCLRPELISLPVVRMPQILWRFTKMGPLPTLGGSRLLDGYWQCNSTVESVRQCLENVLDSHIQTLRNRNTLARPYVAVHIRLGDYLHKKSTSEHHGLSNPHQQIALGREIARDMGLDLKVFTDDLAALRGFNLGVADNELSHVQGAWSALDAMSRASALVMSNSSLSWWAAASMTWRTRAEATVFFPTPWMATYGPKDTDLYVAGWHRYARLFA